MANYVRLKFIEASGQAVELTKEGVNSEPFSIPDPSFDRIRPGGMSAPVTLAIAGVIGAAETITFSYWDGADWRAYNQGGDQLTLDEDDTVVTIEGNITLRATKSVTAADVGVIVHW